MGSCTAASALNWFAAAVAGTLSAIVGSMGLGGGGVLIIYFNLFTQTPQTLAQGINLLFFIPIAVFSVIIYQKDRLIKWRVVIPFTAVGVFASVFGAYLSNSIDDIWLRRGFGVLLLIMGLRELFSKKK